MFKELRSKNDKVHDRAKHRKQEEERTGLNGIYS